MFEVLPLVLSALAIAYVATESGVPRSHGGQSAIRSSSHIGTAPAFRRRRTMAVARGYITHASNRAVADMDGLREVAIHGEARLILRQRR